LYYHLAFIPWS